MPSCPEFLSRNHSPAAPFRQAPLAACVSLTFPYPQGRILNASGANREGSMKYRKLGRTGIEASDLSYGLWGMSGWSGSDDTGSLRSLQASVDLGCNFFDTAWAYGNGKSDGLLGETLARNKNKRLYSASKIPPMNGRWPATPSYAYKDVFPAEHVLKYAKKI